MKPRLFYLPSGEWLFHAIVGEESISSSTFLRIRFRAPTTVGWPINLHWNTFFFVNKKKWHVDTERLTTRIRNVARDSGDRRARIKMSQDWKSWRDTLFSKNGRIHLFQIFSSPVCYMPLINYPAYTSTRFDCNRQIFEGSATVLSDCSSYQWFSSILIVPISRSLIIAKSLYIDSVSTWMTVNCPINFLQIRVTRK